MRMFTQPNGIPAEIVQYMVEDPDLFLVGTLFQQTNGQLWRCGATSVTTCNVGPTNQWVRMTRKDGSLKRGEERWAIEVKK